MPKPTSVLMMSDMLIKQLKTRRGFTQHRYRTQGRGGCTVVGISASWSCALGFSSHVGG